MTLLPDFPASEIEEARRMNRRLMHAPRFRAPTPVTRMMIQTMLRTSQAFMPHGVRGVTTATRRVSHKGQQLNLRILRGSATPRGVYLDYHGGGWAIGNAAMDDHVNARIAGECGLVVVSVDYALLPQTSLLDMIAQCAAAADWLFEHGEAEFGSPTIFIGGESAGAHLAACALLRMRDTRADFARVKGAVLFYGPYDLSCSPSVRAARRDTLILDGPAMTGGLARLLPDRTEEQRRAPDVSPLYADTTGLPPALLLCGTLDPLIDDTRLMAERWSNARAVIVPESPHAFNRLATHLAKRTNAFVRTWITEQLAAASAPAMAAE
jgi:acetyl esterase/lipase